MTRHLQMFALATVLLVALLAAPGCKDKDDPFVPPAPEYVLPFPDTPDQLMANFEAAYGDMDLAAYRDEILAETYDFVLQDETVEEFGLPDNLFDRTDEITIATKMFSGQPNEMGGVISAIEIQQLEPQGGWSAVPTTDFYFGDVPGALVRYYDLLFYFNMAGDFRYEVRGGQLFYVAPDTVHYHGSMTQRYRLCGQLDQSSIMKGTEGETMGRVKALFQ